MCNIHFNRQRRIKMHKLIYTFLCGATLALSLPAAPIPKTISIPKSRPMVARRA